MADIEKVAMGNTIKTMFNKLLNIDTLIFLEYFLVIRGYIFSLCCFSAQ